ncbi:MAG: DPP IV N-terminal domain-containing protein [Gemmatimonadetes bacterium]|nr:DPP IV N-terminal domain-containing protein [Gemmatimonadota bacterium]
MRTRLHLLAMLFVGVAPRPAPAQVTETTYARAEQFLGSNAARFVSGDQATPTWLEGDRFWYRARTEDGSAFILVDPSVPSRRPAFDHARLASALSVAADTAYVANRLPFERFDLEGDTLRFHTADSARWSCRLDTYVCAGPDPVPERPRTEIGSPDGRWVAFSRDENLWVRSVEDGREIQLSQDGAADFGYAVPPEGCCSVVTLARRGDEAPPVLAWSPDSRRILTHRFDERAVLPLHLLEARTGRPALHSYRVALPGDSVIPTYEVHVFDVESRTGVRVDLGPLDVVNTSCCGVASDTVWKDARWGSGPDQVFFTEGVRSFDTLRLWTADARTGVARTVLEETSRTFVESNGQSGGLPNWKVIRNDSEVVWWSERDGWGHLYRFDVATGALLNRITEGPWMVLDLLSVDEAQGWVYFTGSGREPDQDLYHRHLYRARLDGTRTERLTPEDADHQITASPSGRWFVDQYGTFSSAPTTVLRDATGRVVLTLEAGDYSRLLATGWRYPTHFEVKGRDGVTPVHGLLFFPSDYDSTRSYPVVDYIYPGPQVGPIRGHVARVAQGGNAAALAELGFIVFMVDAFGTPGRHKAFHDAYYGDMRDNGLPDHIAALRQLARRHPSMDLDRVGIFGHSGGGFSSTDAILSYPDFFKVAVSSAGNHDNRSYDYTWGEKYQGLLRPNDDGSDSFDAQANQNLAANLQGKLLLMYGTLDDNVHPNATILLIDELIRLNKDFDLIVLPNRNHGYANEPYVVRRTWDYFVRHLLGQEPPSQYRIMQPEG